MGSLDPAKLLVILVIALIVLGPEKLPRVARQLGAAWHELTRIREQVTEEVRNIIPEDAIPRTSSPSRAVSNMLSGLTARAAASAGGTGVMTEGVEPLFPERTEPELDAEAFNAAVDALGPFEEDGDPDADLGDDFAEDGNGRGAGRAAFRYDGRREGALVVVHPSLGDFAFVPDDPSMN